MVSRFVISVVWLVVAIAIGFGVLYFMAEGSASKAERMAEPFGTATAIIASIGLAAIWIPYAYKHRKRRG